MVGSEHPDTLTAKSNLAVTYTRMGRLMDAVKLQEDVLETMEKSLGPENLETITVMSNLAWTYLSQGRWNDALCLHEKALDARKRLLGKNTQTR